MFVETPLVSLRHTNAAMSRFNPNASAFNPNAAAFDPNAAAFGFTMPTGQQFGQPGAPGMPFGVIPGMPQQGAPQGKYCNIIAKTVLYLYLICIFCCFRAINAQYTGFNNSQECRQEPCLRRLLHPRPRRWLHLHQPQSLRLRLHPHQHQHLRRWLPLPRLQ